MKKITVLFFSCAIALSGFSQFKEAMPTLHTPDGVTKRAYTNSKAPSTFQIDYDAAEDNLFTPNYARYIWDLNTQISDSAYMNNMVVTFDSIYDYNTFTTYNYPTHFQTYTVDSIFILGGHENNSGLNNTITVKMVSLNASNYPQIATNLWDTVINTTTSLSSSGNWLTSMVIGLAPNVVMSNGDKFGVMVEFQGEQTDTFGILAGFQDAGACNTSAVSAVRSLFAVNTYAQVTDFASYGLLPTATGQGLYRDCNNNSAYDPGSNEENLLQNGAIWTQVTIDGIVGVDELDNNVNFSVYPNPSNGEFTLNLNSKTSDNVSLVVRNLVGQTIISKKVAVSGKTVETISLSDYSKGVYFLTIDNNTTKLIVE